MTNGNPETWQDQFLNTRRAVWTTTYLFETADKKREQQLKQFVEGIKFTRTNTPSEETQTTSTRTRRRSAATTAQENISVGLGNLDGKDQTGSSANAFLPDKYLSDTWRGLSHFDADKWAPVKPQSGTPNPFASQQAQEQVSFRDSIGIIDQALRARPTVALFTGVTNDETAKALSLPIQSWSQDEEIITNCSSVLCVTPNAALFDEHTRRQAQIIEPPFSTWTERQAIIEHTIKEFAGAYANLSKVDANAITQQTSGMTIHDTESVLLESIWRTHTIEPTFVTKAKVKLLKSLGYELVYPKYGWEALGGYPELKQFYNEFLIRMLDNETARTWNLEPTRGVIEFGLGGTGKSLRAKILAKEAHLPFIKVDSSSIFKGIVGESERTIRQLIRITEANAPCIVFIDEIDQLLLKRGSVMATDSGVQRRTQNMLMDWLGDDERRSIVIAATNRLMDCDIDSIRAGRFDALIPVLPPDGAARRDIIRVHSSVMRKIPLSKALRDETSAEMSELVELTTLWTGAELELLVKESATLALTRKDAQVTLDHFKQAIRNRTLNLDVRVSKIQDFIKEARATAGANSALLEAQADRLNGEMTAYAEKRKAASQSK
jgi:SpoVK/Ycf46/Vps4 family AAA+-type ATPase